MSEMQYCRLYYSATLRVAIHHRASGGALNVRRGGGVPSGIVSGRRNFEDLRTAASFSSNLIRKLEASFNFP